MASPALLNEWRAAELPEMPPSSLLRDSQRDALESELKHAELFIDSRDENDEQYFTRETLDRGIGFFRIQAEYIWKSCGSNIPVPTIGPGPDRSVDLYWKTEVFELLVNIPESAQGTFYARDGNQTAKGTFDPKRFAMPIAAWLMV